LIIIADNLRWIVGDGSVVKAIDEAVRYLPEGSVAQVIVPAELGYPASGDSEHDLVGPK
jgi:FKBP-type peptidyl-prolyl cis-trans isomerase